jgi:hypothetical protein
MRKTGKNTGEIVGKSGYLEAPVSRWFVLIQANFEGRKEE